MLLASSFLRPLVGCLSSCPQVFLDNSVMVPVLVVFSCTCTRVLANLGH